MKRYFLPALFCLVCSCSDLNFFNEKEIHYLTLGYLVNELDDSLMVSVYASSGNPGSRKDYVLKTEQETELFEIDENGPGAPALLSRYFDSIAVRDFSGQINILLTPLFAGNYNKNPFTDPGAWDSWSTAWESKDLVTKVLYQTDYYLRIKEEFITRISMDDSSRMNH
ncbi:MAG: hypothetical protein U0T82_12880 [Bacteroidales bacterium]